MLRFKVTGDDVFCVLKETDTVSSGKMPTDMLV